MSEPTAVVANATAAEEGQSQAEKEANAASSSDTESKLSKKERKRLKKEKKRAKKEKKKAKKEKKRAKKEKQSPEAASSSSSSSTTSFNSNAENAAQFSDTENNMEGEQTAKFSDTEESINVVEGQSVQSSQASAAKMDANDNTNDNLSDDGGKVSKIPRKRKRAEPETGTGISLIANVEPAKPKAPEIMDVDEEDFRDNDQDNSDEEDDDDPSMSLTDLKRKILGRNLRTHGSNYDHEDDDIEEKDRKPAAKIYGASQSVTPALRSELTCSICHEPYLNPVSLLCGHNYCSECMHWWLQSTTSRQGKNCPTCRRDIPQEEALSLGVNTSLRACVMALLGNELQARMDAAREVERQATKGENGGAHERGYELLVSLDQDSWKTTAGWNTRRSVVLDAEDQRMQLALGIWKDSTAMGIHYNSSDQKLEVSLCLLTMEEDEVADSGFPRLIHEEDDENENLLVSHQGGRFVHSFVQAIAKGTGRSIPLARRAIQANGVALLSFKLSSEDMTSVHTVSFRHEESGANLELKFPTEMNLSSGARKNIGGRTAASAVELNEYHDDEDEDEDDEGHDKGYLDSEDDGSHLDHFEKDDGFIVDEASEGHDEEDLCWSCKKGGELMVCDGGDHYEGCGRSFHIECVNRDEIPPGDWICQKCANDLALDAGVEGHEFPPEGEVVIEDSDEGEDGLVDSPSPKMKRKRKRNDKHQEVVDIHDSDSDKDEKDSNKDEKPPADDEGSQDEKPAAKKASKRRICVIDDSDDDE